MENFVDTDQLRSEVRSWLADHWKGVDDQAYRHAVVRDGWAVPTFPKDAYGRDLGPTMAEIVRAEFDSAGAPHSSQELGYDQVAGWVRMAASAVARFGNSQLKETFIRDLLTGEADQGVALYSEPSAGSDLAGLQTRAVLHGDHWIVNGQKVWSSQAVGAHWGLLLARTNEDVPKHQGISFFIVPMDQPGIEIRPIKQITGESEFNEVFLTDATVPVDNVVGEVDDGWRVLQEVLAAEREWLGAHLEAGKAPRAADDESDRHDAPLAADLAAAARRAGRADDPVVRQTIAQLYSWRMVHQWNNDRLSSEDRAADPHSQVAAAALGKLAASRILHSVGQFKARMLGPEALLYGPDHPRADDVNRDVMNAFINSVGGGSDQIQRNLISERVLGLPRGHAPDRGVPFREIRKGSAERSLSS